LNKLIPSKIVLVIFINNEGDRF